MLTYLSIIARTLGFVPLCLIITLSAAHAAPPRLNFADLISGPDSGLDDSKGSGVIVTIWGQHLEPSQGSSAITFTDSNGTVHNAPYIYYWKNSDGKLPGGPANLYESHAMQEIAFSIPAAADGLGYIIATVNDVASNALPFTIRDGAIYHVKSSGNDTTGDGSSSKPWATIDKAFDTINTPGATIYIYDNLASGSENVTGLMWDNSNATSGLANQFSIAAYPGSQPTVTGNSGIRNWRTAGLVISKFTVFASNCEEDSNGQVIQPCRFRNSSGIDGSAFGRAVGNRLTDQPGGCASSQGAAIAGNALDGDRASAFQILGNEIHDYGCPGSSKFQHTTYMSVRSGALNLQIDPWRFGWNYLHDNHTKSGIHNFDESQKTTTCGTPTGTIIINDNVVINQGGAGIFIGSTCPWISDFDIYNNIIINSGLPVSWDGKDPNTSIGTHSSAMVIMDGGLHGTIKTHNNIFHTWDKYNFTNGTGACLELQGAAANDFVTINWDRNICYSPTGKTFVGHNYLGPALMDNISGSHNLWHHEDGAVSVPSKGVSNSLTSDPNLSIFSTIMRIDRNSPAVGVTPSIPSHDIYGRKRPTNATLGAVEYTPFPPSSPSNLTLE